MAARTIWSGSLTFGLVSVPVGLYPATRDKSVHFNQFEEGTSDRIRYKKVNERTGEEVPPERIIRGVDLGDGEYVMVTDDELEASEPERSHEIEVRGFISLEEIDPIYFRSTYYVAPGPKATDKAYALLRAAMKRSNKVAIASLIMRNKEYLVAIRPSDETLVLETLYFADEIREPSQDLPALPGTGVVSARELKMADLLIDSMAMEWDPTQYHDTHRQQIEALVERKRDGEAIEVGAQPDRAPVVDLMQALEASMRSRREATARGSANRAVTKKASTSKKAAASKKTTPSKRAPAKRPAKKSARPLRRAS